MNGFIQDIYARMDNFRLSQCIRSGLLMMFPILLIGSFALIFRSLPLAAYQRFIATSWSGAIYQFFSFIYEGTFGLLAVYMTASTAICYGQQYVSPRRFNYGSVFTALACFCIFSDFQASQVDATSLGVNGMFTAIVCALGASSLYYRISDRLPRMARLYTDGADGKFNSAIATIIPSFLVICAFSLINQIFSSLFHEEGFQMIFIDMANSVFANTGRSLGGMLLFSFFSSLLWFFGIHGSDILDPVSQSIFQPGVQINQQLLENGQVATEIFSKSFFDVFVAMGGCGSAICLLIALLLFGRRRSNRNLAQLAALPMLFNVNEILIFGLPVIFNPILLIPFIVTPLILVLISSLAMVAGLVPLAAVEVEWTTPILMGGYLATGSMAGAALQLFNVVVGVLIYRPFVLLFDREAQRNAQQKMEQLLRDFRRSEEAGEPLELLTLQDSVGVVSKTLAEDIDYRLANQLPTMFYQPQYNADGRCCGMEALLRWQHPLYGMIYPPMIVKLAHEMGLLMQLEKSIFRVVVDQMDHMRNVLSADFKVSVNVFSITIQTDEFERFLAQLRERYPRQTAHICIEITEQTALQTDDVQIARLMRIHDMGYALAIDDFSMGSTSIRYLQTNVFDVIKLDGSLIRDITTNVRSRQIVESIVKLADTFGIQVLAEFVETEEQRAILESIGCRQYQGYLYSPALPADQLEHMS